MPTFISHRVGKKYYSDETKFVIYFINQDDEEDEIWDATHTEEEAKLSVENNTSAYDSPDWQFRYEVKPEIY